MKHRSTHWSGAESVANRRGRSSEIDPPPLAVVGEDDRTLHIADLDLDTEWHAVSRSGRPITLTRIQFHLLAMLVVHARDVVNYDDLITQAWGHMDEESPASLIKPHISRLRRKLELEPLGPLLIKARPGQGYMLHVCRQH